MNLEWSDILLEYSRDGVMIISSDLSHWELNQSVREMLGGEYTTDPNLKPSLPELYRRLKLPTSNLKDIREHLKTKQTTGIFESDFINYNNQVIPLEIKIDCKKNANIEHYCFIVRDITPCKEREKKLKTALEEVNQAKDKAEQSNRLKTAFLSNMSHEIRTPMNSIIGFSELLDDNTINSGERSAIVKIIQTNSEKLLRLINNIIDISRLQSGDLKLDLEEVDLHKFLSGFYEQWKNKLPEEKNELSLNIKLPEINRALISSDTLRLKNIMDHLIDNAIKFSEKGSIELGFNVNDSYVELYVKDEGLGINKEQQQELFEVFNKISLSDNELVEGTGIGLTLVKSFVELMGGKVEIDSEVNKGTNIKLLFPFVKVYTKVSNMASNNGASTNKHQWPNKRVLIVEDNDYNYEYLFTVLHQRVKEIVWAPTGTDAIMACERECFDLILLDMQLPDMHGLEVLQYIKTISEETPVIAQTAFAIVGDKQRIIEAGCNDYLSKPIKPAILLQTIDKFLKMEEVYEKHSY